MIKRLTVVALLLGAGWMAGLVTAGRASDRADTLASMPDPADLTGDASAGTPQTPSTPASLVAPADAQRPVAVSAGPDFTRVAAQSVKAVTNISSVQAVRRSASPFANDPFFQYFFGEQGEMFGRGRAESSLGSGVVISADGYVVTNNHVLGDDVAEVTVTVGDRRDVRATIVGVDSWTDLALLKIDATDLPVIPWGDSSTLRVAEWVMAVGNPFSLNQTVTLGIVSALGRANIGITAYEDFIQTDAAINPGNSGGALINARGELVGINTAIFSQNGGYQGIGFAVPSNLVRRVVDDLKQYGQVRRGSIGYVEVMPLNSRLADELRAPQTDGVVVNRMERASAAFKSGLQPGDVVLAVNGVAIADPSQFMRVIADSRIGSTAQVEVLRDGQRTTLKIPVEAQGRRQRRR